MTRISSIYACRRPGAAAAVQGAAAWAAAAAGSSEVLGLLAAGPGSAQPCNQDCRAASAPHSSRSFSSAAWDAPTVPRSGSGGSDTARGDYSGGTRPLKNLQLVRDFIHDSLYHPSEGYFSKKTASGGVPPLPLPLPAMRRGGEQAAAWLVGSWACSRRACPAASPTACPAWLRVRSLCAAACRGGRSGQPQPAARLPQHAGPDRLPAGGAGELLGWQWAAQLCPVQLHPCKSL